MWPTTEAWRSSDHACPSRRQQHLRGKPAEGEIGIARVEMTEPFEGPCCTKQDALDEYSHHFAIGRLSGSNPAAQIVGHAFEKRTNERSSLREGTRIVVVAQMQRLMLERSVGQTRELEIRCVRVDLDPVTIERRDACDGIHIESRARSEVSIRENRRGFAFDLP